MLSSLVPKAIAWAETQAALILKHGASLTVFGISDARTVGVAFPEKIRVAFVDSLPLPDDAELRAVAIQEGLLVPGMVGLTPGYGIFIVRGYETRRLLSHEFRHVNQYEHAGSIAAFMPTYLQQIAAVGYRDAGLEIDARQHELQ